MEMAFAFLYPAVGWFFYLFLPLAAAFLLAGGLIFGWQVWLLAHRSNTAEFPAVARFYRGFNVLICGLVAMVALVVGLGAALAEEVPWMVFKIGASLFVVYGSAWFFQTHQLLRSPSSRIGS